jgi:hypothetical protein
MMRVFYGKSIVEDGVDGAHDEERTSKLVHVPKGKLRASICRARV